MSIVLCPAAPADPTLQFGVIPIFNDNYVWLLCRDGEAVVVDPGEAAPVRAALDGLGLRLSAVLITHHHFDHVGGIAALNPNGDVPVYGPRAEADKIKGLTVLLDDGDQVELLGCRLDVLAVPGHTLRHIAYHLASAARLFCGDTLFSGGCGRLFEGSPAQMKASLDRLAALPDDTAVHCTHEYTESNLAFAAAVEPASTALAEYRRWVTGQRHNGEPTLPSRIGLERRINPFLRCNEPAVHDAAARHADRAMRDAVDIFATLRAWKDHFRPPAATT